LYILLEIVVNRWDDKSMTGACEMSQITPTQFPKDKMNVRFGGEPPETAQGNCKKRHIHL
jgi:hypothetical protein